MDVFTYQANPEPGSRWRGRGSDGAKTETRKVIDRTFGGDVIFRAGRKCLTNQPKQVKLRDWVAWAETAKQL